MAPPWQPPGTTAPQVLADRPLQSASAKACDARQSHIVAIQCERSCTGPTTFRSRCKGSCTGPTTLRTQRNGSCTAPATIRTRCNGSCTGPTTLIAPRGASSRPPTTILSHRRPPRTRENEGFHEVEALLGRVIPVLSERTRRNHGEWRCEWSLRWSPTGRSSART